MSGILSAGLAALAMACFCMVCTAQPTRPAGGDPAYWRGAREESPGAFLCVRPAATNVTVVCDRWPDCSDLRRFGLDAIRLSGAKTEQEKCLAVWRWVRRCTMCTNGTPPTENFTDPRQSPFGGGYILDPLKIFNVYGAHWCSGLSQAVETVWRALGYRAEKVNFHGHTVVDCYYRDLDGVERWHVMDVDSGGYVLDRTGRRLMTLDELTYDTFTDWMFGWMHGQHLDMPTYRADLALRTGESLRRDWSNWGEPYLNNVGKMAQWVGGDKDKGASIERIEHGPYPYAFGNGRWTYAPDLSKPGWADGLAAPPQGMAAGRLMPAAAGTPAVAEWRFRTPFIVADAEVHLKLVRKSSADTVRLHLSVDDGRTFRPLWECPADAVGRQDLVVPICEKFAMSGTGKRKSFSPPEGFNSPFGRYHYRLRLELLARGAPADCRVEGITFATTVQQNYYSLPQLQPGRNRITVKGDLADGAALKVTCLWDDPSGADRQNVTVVERTPFTYEIIAGGEKWEDCVCRSITVEAVPATGQGNRTLAKETPAPFADLPPMRPVHDTRECMLIKPDMAKAGPADELIADLGRPERAGDALRALVELKEPKAFDAIRKLAYEIDPPSEWKNPLMGVKEAALAALYAVDPARARPVLLDILCEPTHSKWQPVSDWSLPGTWHTGAAIIGYIAADAGWKEFVPGIVKALQTPKCREDTIYGLLRALGRLGDPRAAPAIRESLRDGTNLDTVYFAALAAGQVGDRESIPQLRKFLHSGYPPAELHAALALAMLHDAASAPAVRDWLTRSDEDFRGAAADVLAALGDKPSIPALEAAVRGEPFPWVRKKMTDALAALKSDAPPRPITADDFP